MRQTGSVKKKPIEYIAMRYPISYDPKDLKSNQEEVTKLLNILAESEQDSYFKTSYIQQLIDYQWES